MPIHRKGKNIDKCFANESCLESKEKTLKHIKKKTKNKNKNKKIKNIKKTQVFKFTIAHNPQKKYQKISKKSQKISSL